MLVPDVNRSESDFACELGRSRGRPEDAIRFGLSAVRNVGEGVVGADHRGARSDGPVRRLLRLLRARRSERAQQAHDRVVDQGGWVRLARPSPQGSAHRVRADRRRDLAPPARARPGHDEPVRHGWAETTDDSPVFDDRLPIPDLEFAKSERLRVEKEMLGLYVSDHPLMGAEPVLRAPHRMLDRGAGRPRRRFDRAPSRASSPVSTASTRSAATSWPRSCSRISAPRSK